MTTDARNVLLLECQSAIREIGGAEAPRDCPAHGPMARGVIALLRCEQVRLEAEVADQRTMHRWLIEHALAVAAVAAALACGVLVGQVPRLVDLLEWLK